MIFLNDWLSFEEGERMGGIGLKLDVQAQGGGRILNVDGQGSGGSLKLDNFHGRHMCIIPKVFAILALSTLAK